MSTRLRLIVVFAVLLVMGISIAYSATRDSAEMAKGMPDFNEMMTSDFYEGGFVQGTIYELYDEFAYLEEYQTTFGIKHGERVTAHYYIMPLVTSYDSETPKFVAVCLKNAEMISTAEKMMQETWDYWDYGTAPEVWTELPITGKVSKLDGELLDYFYEWLMYGDEGAARTDYADYICPYLITYYKPSASHTLLIMGIVLMIVGIGGLGVTVTLSLKERNAAAAPAAAETAYPTAARYEPVNPASAQNDSLMQQLSAIKQPEDNTEAFFGSPAPTLSQAPEKEEKKTEAPAANGSYSDMDSIDTSGLGIGIDD